MRAPRTLEEVILKEVSIGPMNTLLERLQEAIRGYVADRFNLMLFKGDITEAEALRLLDLFDQLFPNKESKTK